MNTQDVAQSILSFVPFYETPRYERVSKVWQQAALAPQKLCPKNWIISKCKLATKFGFPKLKIGDANYFNSALQTRWQNELQFMYQCMQKTPQGAALCTYYQAFFTQCTLDVQKEYCYELVLPQGEVVLLSYEKNSNNHELRMYEKQSQKLCNIWSESDDYGGSNGIKNDLNALLDKYAVELFTFGMLVEAMLWFTRSETKKQTWNPYIVFSEFKTANQVAAWCTQEVIVALHEHQPNYW